MSGLAANAARCGTTGKAAHFSEQQVMDCSWDYEGNSACDGGNYDGALDYLIDAGGAALDSEYEYLGQDGWCVDKNHSDTHTTNLTKFKVQLPWPCLAPRLRNPHLNASCNATCTVSTAAMLTP